MEPNWLKWGRELQAIAQNGLTYCKDKYDIERYHQLRQIAAKILAAGNNTAIDPADVIDIFIREKDYATPKVDVRAAVFKNGQILLVRETSDGKWSLPGGWADINATPTENVIRETKEESGFDVKVNQLAAIYDRSCHEHKPLMHYHIYKMFFICEIIGGTATCSIETDKIEFFNRNELPELSITKVLAFQIDKMFDYYNQPELKVYCD